MEQSFLYVKLHHNMTNDHKFLLKTIGDILKITPHYTI